MPLLDESDINLEIENLPEWNYIEKTITKDYSFDTYSVSYTHLTLPTTPYV